MNLDGDPVDRSDIEALTAKLRRRGPDAKATWVEGNVGLGHALLRTTSGRESGGQPMSLDGQVWITADARVDDRVGLVRELVGADGPGLRRDGELDDASDEALILHAYHAWGEACVERLLGDFAFAIWDRRRRRLLCARDQLGIKPLFFVIAGRLLLFSSELDCLRGHPKVSDELDDLAIADFLMFGGSQEPDATAFAAVRRLPPAHTISWSGGRPRVERYWELSIPPEAHYAREEDCLQRLDELLRQAVRDRLRTERAGVLFSGGVDSTTLAAVAKRELARGHSEPLIRAHTVSFAGLIADEEVRFARIAAGALGIPLEVYEGDADPLFAAWEEPAWSTPEPSSNPYAKLTIDLIGGVARGSRVALTGYDGDTLCLVELASHFRRLIKRLRIRRAVADAWWLASTRRSLPPIGVRTWLRGPAQRRRIDAQFPSWLAEDLISRLELRARWRGVQAPRRRPDRGVRADAVELMTGAPAAQLFDSYDSAWTMHPVEVRHPLFDLRLVEFLLSLPPIPWAVNKTVLRRAAQTRSLPASVTARPKAPLAEDPARALLRRSGDLQTRALPRSAVLDRYLAVQHLPPLAEVERTELLWPMLRAFSLQHWLCSHSLAGS